jgi:hypothetical protein
MLILPEFLISGLKLFQSRVVEGKKDFLVILPLYYPGLSCINVQLMKGT